jgi:putative Holliday junction resolvase
MVIIGIDIGTVRVGAAVSDSGVAIPFPLAVWPKAQGRAEKELLLAIDERKAELLVVGLPLGPNGERTATCDVVETFTRRLSKRTSIKIVYIDESFSSEEAAERLKAAGADRQELDAYAACLILERYLANQIS